MGHMCRSLGQVRFCDNAKLLIEDTSIVDICEYFRVTSSVRSTLIPITRCPNNIVPRLCGCCGGAVDSFISHFTQLHSSGFNLAFETLYETIWQVVADLPRINFFTPCLRRGLPKKFFRHGDFAIF